MPLAQTPAEKKRLEEALLELLGPMQSHARLFAEGKAPVATRWWKSLYGEFPNELLTDPENDEFVRVLERWDDCNRKSHSERSEDTLQIIGFCEKVLKKLKRSAKPKRNSARPEIRISRDGSTVSVNGKIHRLTGADDGAFLRLLLRKRGQSLKAAAISRAIGKRADRLYQQLPPAVRQLILRPSYKGSRQGYCLP